jgi:uncharacterized protein YkwD
MSVLTPAGSRPGERARPTPPPPEPREQVTHGLDHLTGRILIGVGAVVLLIVGSLGAIAVTRGGSEEATLTAPAPDATAEVATEGAELEVRQDDGGDTGLAAGGIGSSADAADDVAAAGDPSATTGSSTQLPSSVAPPTLAPNSASSTPATDAPTTAAPTTAAPTTAAPTTAAPTTAAPTTAAPTTAAPATAPPPTAPPSGGSAEQQVLGLVNSERANAGCGPVSLNGQLNAAALGHSQDMSANGYFSHTGLNGSQPWDRAVAAGYSYRSIGENIAQGYGSASAVMQGWMNSSGHRANILNCSFTEMGLGLTGQDSYWTQLFGRPG